MLPYSVELGVVADAAAFWEAVSAGIEQEPADTEKRAFWEGKVADLVVWRSGRHSEAPELHRRLGPFAAGAGVDQR